MGVQNEKSVLTLVINGEAAKNTLKEIRMELGKQKALLDNMREDDPKYGEQVESVRALTRATKERAAAVQQIGKAWDGFPLNSIARLEAEYKQINEDIKMMTVGTNAYINAAGRMDKITGELNNHTIAIGKAESGWGKFKSVAMEVGVGVGIGNGLTMAAQYVGSAIPNMIRANTELSDSITNIRKNSDLTEDGVKELMVSFREFSTRTPREELMKLAVDAGKAGVEGKAAILEYVEGANMVKVALGDDMEGSIEALGKLNVVFKQNDAYGFKEAMLKTGSAINELTKSGIASAPYLVDYAKRLAGINVQAGISIDKTLAYGATLESLGQNVETSATAIGQLTTLMFNDPAKYAQIAGIKVGEFNKLLNTDANEALIKLLEGLRGNNGAFGELVQNLDAAGLEGARATQVLAALSNNVDLLRKNQDIGNKSYAEGISLTNEYALANDNLAGRWERLKQTAGQLTTLGLNMTAAIVNGATGFIKVLGDVSEWIGRNTALLIALGSGYLALNAKIIASTYATIAESLASKEAVVQLALENAAVAIGNTVNAARTTLLGIQITVQKVLSREIAISTGLLRIWNLTVAENPLGLLVLAIGAVVTALVVYSKNTSEAISIEKAKIQNMALLERANNLGTKSQAFLNQRIEEFNKLSEKEQEQILKVIEAKKKSAELDLELAKKRQNDAVATGGKATIGDYAVGLFKSDNGIAGAMQEAVLNAQIRQKDIANEHKGVIEGLTGKLKIYTDLQKKGTDISTAETRAMEIQTNTIAAQREKLALLNIALEHTQRGSVKYKRVENEIKEVNALLGNSSVTTGTATESEKSKAEAKIKAAKEAAEYVRKQLKELGAKSLSDDEKAIAELGLKYAALVEKAGSNSSLVNEVQSQFQKELGELVGRQADANAAAAQKEADAAAAAELKIREVQAVADDVAWEAMLSDDERELLAVDKKYEALLLKANFNEEQLAAVKLKWEKEKSDLTLKNESKMNAEVDALQRAALNKKLQNIQDQAMLAKNISSIFSGVFQIMAGDSAEAAEFNKAMALVNIGISTAEAIANVIAYATASPTNAITGGLDIPIKIAAGVATILGNVIQAQAQLNAPTPKQPTYGKAKYSRGVLSVGGSTHQEGGNDIIDNSTGEVLGEMEKGEAFMVLSKEFTQANQPLISALLASSADKSGTPFMANQWAMNRTAIAQYSGGGIQQTSGSNNTVLSAENGNGDNREMLLRLDGINASLVAFTGRIRVVYTDIEDTKVDIDRARTNARASIRTS